MPPSCTELFRLLADETRLRCLVLLYLEGELCVCELVYALGEIQPKISRHLAILRDQGVVVDRRAGQWVYYRIDPDLPDWAHEILRIAAGRAGDKGPSQRDLRALRQMPARPDAVRCA